MTSSNAGQGDEGARESPDAAPLAPDGSGGGGGGGRREVGGGGVGGEGGGEGRGLGTTISTTTATNSSGEHDSELATLAEKATAPAIAGKHVRARATDDAVMEDAAPLVDLAAAASKRQQALSPALLAASTSAADNEDEEAILLSRQLNSQNPDKVEASAPSERNIMNNNDNNGSLAILGPFDGQGPQFTAPYTPNNASVAMDWRSVRHETFDFTVPLGFQHNTNPYSAAQAVFARGRPSNTAQIPHLGSTATTTVSPYNLNLADNGPDGADQEAPQPRADHSLQSFAYIEFPDSVFQMTTYAVIIGRDQKALRQARKDERKQEEYERLVKVHVDNNLEPPLPPMPEPSRKFSKSYVSEEGGMLGPESDGGSEDPMPKRRKPGSAGSLHGEDEVDERNVIKERQYVSHTPGAAVVDLDRLRPSVHHTPLIGIHSPGPNIAKKTMAISRRHMKIAFDPDRNVFEAIPLHHNGFFCDDQHYSTGRCTLSTGAQLQIKDVNFTFHINGVEVGETGGEQEDGQSSRRYSEGGKEMSVDFELSHSAIESDSEKLSELVGSVSEPSPLGEASAAASASPDSNGGDSSEGGGGEDDSAPKPGQSEAPPKRRGPGRPPKDGIMSRKQRREIQKREKEEAMLKERENQQAASPEAQQPAKRKVGRPRKVSGAEEGGGSEPPRGEKRKYKPRKPKEEGEEGENESEASGPEKKKPKKDPPRPKTPPLELRKEDYTDEQLLKPPKNYSQLIDEILTEAVPHGLPLKSIYKRIEIRYPYYHFYQTTKGWESSVRHNLIGNAAFQKHEPSGIWHRMMDIDLDAGKKKKGESSGGQRAAGTGARARGQAANNQGIATDPASLQQYYVQQQMAGQGGTVPMEDLNNASMAGPSTAQGFPDGMAQLAHLGAATQAGPMLGMQGLPNGGNVGGGLPNGAYAPVNGVVQQANLQLHHPQPLSAQQAPAGVLAQGIQGHPGLAPSAPQGATQGMEQANMFAAQGASTTAGGAQMLPVSHGHIGSGQVGAGPAQAFVPLPAQVRAISNIRLRDHLADCFLDLINNHQVSPLMCLRGLTGYLGLREGPAPAGVQEMPADAAGQSETVVASVEQPEQQAKLEDATSTLPDPLPESESNLHTAGGEGERACGSKDQLGQQDGTHVSVPILAQSNIKSEPDAGDETMALAAVEATGTTTVPAETGDVEMTDVADPPTNQPAVDGDDESIADPEVPRTMLEEEVSRVFTATAESFLAGETSEGPGCSSPFPLPSSPPELLPPGLVPLLRAAFGELQRDADWSDQDEDVAEFVFLGAACAVLGFIDGEPRLWWLKDDMAADVLQRWSQRLETAGFSGMPGQIWNFLRNSGFVLPPPRHLN